MKKAIGSMLLLLILIIPTSALVFLNRDKITSSFEEFADLQDTKEIATLDSNKITLSPIEPIEIDKIETDFAKFDIFTIPNMSELKNYEYDYQENCGNGATDNFRRNLASISTKSYDGKSEFYVFRIDDPESYLGTNSSYDDSYKFLENLLKATPDYIDQDIRNNALQNIIYRYCSGDFQRIFQIREVKAYGYTNSKIIYSYGSTQSPSDSSNFFPFSMHLVAQDDAKNLYLAQFIDLTLFDFLDQNTISNCEESVNGTNLINIFDNDQHKCVVEEFNSYKDPELLELFEKALISKL